MQNILAHRLGAYAVQADFDQLPADVQTHLIDAFVNWIGCAIGGASSPTSDAFARAAGTWAPQGAHRAIGRGERFGLIESISLDCLSSAVQAFDDTHLETVLHPTGPVAAALMGQARLTPMSGRDFLSALHVGMEVECRTGLAITAEGTGSRRGWYLTGVTGGIGAAAAVGRTLRFDEAQMHNAMGLAAARASGNRGTHGSMAAAYVPSIAAESGFMAAHLTLGGLGCTARALDGSNGLLDLVTDRPGLDRALLDLGTVSEAARTAFKPFPAGIVAHPVIEACLELVHHHHIGEEMIAALDFSISQTAHDLVANKFPTDVVQAQVSLFYWGAVALSSGAAGVEQAAPHLVSDPAIQLLQSRMTATVSPGMADDQCVAVATLRDGREVRVAIEHCIGSISRPMTSADIDRKFLALARSALPEERAQRVHGACRNILALDDVSTILALC